MVVEVESQIVVGDDDDVVLLPLVDELMRIPRHLVESTPYWEFVGRFQPHLGTLGCDDDDGRGVDQDVFGKEVCPDMVFFVVEVSVYKPTFSKEMDGNY